MKVILIVACIVIPLWAASIEETASTDEKTEVVPIEESPVEIFTPKKEDTDIDVDNYRGPEQNKNSQVIQNATFKREFNGNSYEVLTGTTNGVLNYVTLDYDHAVEACKNVNSEPRTLLTFKSAEENDFIANWLFKELEIVTQVWIGLTRVNGSNDFVWADGTKLTQANEEKLYKNWHKCEPNDITTIGWSVEGWGEDCVEMYSSFYPYPLRCDEAARTGQWNDIPCKQIYNMVVCQGKIAKQ
ncbi:Low affinity immunoglobulin epsilon Fc receptor [Pseudolycoriella hygida]|uniref:Low affinity immunoglobulin epsilon Fc receptor n=1 Tax=Pseudolycoriella hygida TaxID=35572 RepID=A0A9Q0MLI4_9DIPT|nr:Low affinity immunoglobulin epsilon Fc receptor [Pseudolycoriella hygida]